MVIRIRYRRIGDHYHGRVFLAKTDTPTSAKVGDLIVDVRDWPEIRTLLRTAVEFVEEEGDALTSVGGGHGSHPREVQRT